MWNIYADEERRCAITFDEDFLDIRDNNENIVGNFYDEKYPLYTVQYCDDIDSLHQNTNIRAVDLCNIWKSIEKIEQLLQEYTSGKKHMKKTENEIRMFVIDRINEIRFLFKSTTYQYENELRLVHCSHNPQIDDENFTIPRLYIEVDKKIDNISVQLGAKLSKEEIAKAVPWLNGTGKVLGITKSRFM